MAIEAHNVNTPSDERLVFRPETEPAGDVLVTVMLRGGMDSVYTIPPLGDARFAELRKQLGFAAASRKGATLLDDFFGLHPDFALLEPLYRQNMLAVVQAVGLHEPILSHFDATRAMERGLEGGGAENGWIARHLAVGQDAGASPLRAIAFDNTLPLVLRGSQARAIDSLADFRLELPPGWKPGFPEALARLYARGADTASQAGRDTLKTLAALERLTSSEYQPENRARYSYDRFGAHMRQVAQLIKAEVGLEAAVLSIYGWDTHVAQESSIAQPMRSLAKSLGAFAQDLGDRMRRVVVVVLSEFGRRVAPNGAGGTDHGRGGAMLVAGGGIRGGKVYGKWPGLGVDNLDEVGNLRVTTDYRHVLSEIVDRRLGNRAVERVFPDFQPTYLGLTS